MTLKELKKAAKWLVDNHGSKWGAPGNIYSVVFHDFDHDFLEQPEDVKRTILELVNELD